jgi:hypothetical protein
MEPNIIVQLEYLDCVAVFSFLSARQRVSSYSTRASDSLLVPRFCSRNMKDSVAYRGSTLWNTVTYKHNGLLNTT